MAKGWKEQLPYRANSNIDSWDNLYPVQVYLFNSCVLKCISKNVSYILLLPVYLIHQTVNLGGYQFSNSHRQGCMWRWFGFVCLISQWIWGTNLDPFYSKFALCFFFLLPSPSLARLFCVQLQGIICVCFAILDWRCQSYTTWLCFRMFFRCQFLSLELALFLASPLVLNCIHIPWSDLVIFLPITWRMAILHVLGDNERNQVFML